MWNDFVSVRRIQCGLWGSFDKAHSSVVQAGPTSKRLQLMYAERLGYCTGTVRRRGTLTSRGIYRAIQVGRQLQRRAAGHMLAIHGQMITGDTTKKHQLCVLTVGLTKR